MKRLNPETWEAILSRIDIPLYRCCVQRVSDSVLLAFLNRSLMKHKHKRACIQIEAGGRLIQ